MFQTLSKNEREFLVEAINLDCRADARTAKETRLIRQAQFENQRRDAPWQVDQIRFGEENGQVMVRMGQTKIVTQSTLKMVSPKPGKPNEGDLKITCEFASLLHSAEFFQQTTTLSEMRIELSSFIDKVLKQSRATDREGLSIIQGKLAWSLTIELQLLNDDGNLIDAFFLAAILALKNTRLPEVSMKGDDIMVSNTKFNYVNVHHLPVCTTFYFIPKVEQPIVDASAKEERLATARLSICMNVFEDVCGMQTLGQMDIDPMQLLECTRDALAITKQTTKIIRQAWEQRRLNHPLLSMSASGKAAGGQVANQRGAQSFIDQLNQDINGQASQDKKGEERKRTEVSEAELIDMIKKNKTQGRKSASRPAPQQMPARRSQQEPETVRVGESSQLQDQLAADNVIDTGERVMASEQVISASSRRQMQKEQIEVTDPGELSLTQAIKQRRSKRKN